MSLRAKIVLGYGLVFLLAGVVIAWALANLVRLGAASDAILSENYRSIEAAEQMLDALERQDSAVLLTVLGEGDEGVRQFEANQGQFARALGRAEDNVTIPGEAAVIDSIGAAYTAYAAEFSDLLRGGAGAGGAAEGGAAGRLYQDRMVPPFRATEAAVARLRDLNERTMVAASDRAGAVAGRAVRSVLAVGGVALALALGLSLAFAGRIVAPLRQMEAAAQRVAAGDLTAEVPAGGSDELGALAAQFNRMTARLRAYRTINVERLVVEERKGAAVIEAVDDGLVVVRADLVVDGMNPAAGEALGVDPRLAVGRPLAEVVSDEGVLETVRAAVAAAGAEAAPPAEPAETFLNVERGGEARHYQPVATPVRTDDDALVGAILLLRDVTKLRELDRMKSEFVATASHELKTPLTSMGMSVGLLQERAAAKLSDRERELLDAAAEDVDRLKALVRDLLDLSKIEAGRVELDLAEVPVRLLVDRAVSGLRLQADEAGVALAVDVPDGLPDVVADPTRIVWVVTNLVANALRYTDRGGHVTVAAEAAGPHVEVSVADDGEGVPVEMQGRIFDKFVQVEGERAVGGSGLGLAISKELVHAHGGTIWVDSAPGEGATFTFTLPAADGPPRP